MSEVRCFAGIPLPSCIAEPVADAARAIRDADHSWRDEKWVPMENLHVTLKFLGSHSASDAEALSGVICDAVADHGCFDLPLAGLRPVPQTRRCRMLWVSFRDPDGMCAALAEKVEGAALAFGVEPDARAFVPHVTLCRARRPKAISERAIECGGVVLADVSTAMSVPSVTVFASRLTPRGPIYSPIGSRSLRGD